MIGVLPTSLEINGVSYPINSDFRIVLRIFQAIADEELSNAEKAYITVKLLYKCNIPMELFAEAVERAYWFCDGGDMPKSEASRVKTFDWERDESILFPSINKTLGYEVRSCPYLHWWTFLGTFGEISDGLFSQVMNIRNKIAQGKKPEKWEKEFIKRSKALFDLSSKEEQEAVRETEEFLKTLI